MRRAARPQPDWILPLNVRPSQVQIQRSASLPELQDTTPDLLLQNEFHSGSGSIPTDDPVGNAWTQHPRRTYSSQPSTWIPKLGSNESQQSLDLADPRDHDNETRVIRTAKNLLQRFKASEQYIRYRGRQQKDIKHEQEQKWPDHLEEAFFRALVKYPPMGRRMLLHKGKQRGRNELIADEIKELTDEERSRKQISSHIQVLKPFVKHDSQIMKFLSKDDLCSSVPHRVPRGRRASSMMPRTSYHNDSSYPQRRSMTTPMPGFPATVNRGPHTKTFEPANFQIFVQQVYEGCVRRLHTYTQFIRHDPLSSIVISDTAMLQQNFPQLAHLHAQNPLTCGVLVADSSFAFPPEPFGKLPGVELGVQLQFLSRRITPDVPVRCHNTFYHHGQAFPDQTDPASTVSFTAANYGQGSEASVKFGSSFWAKHLSHLSQNFSDATRFDHRADQGDLAAYIAGITALQQITMSDKHGNYEPILLILWTFRQSEGAQGSTSWRNLILPQLPTAGVSQSSVPTALRATCNTWPFDHTTSHGPPINDAHTMMTSIDHHMATHSGVSSSDERDSRSSGSALSAYTWNPTAYSNPVPWSTADSIDTFDLPHRDDDFSFDPLLCFSNAGSTALNDFDATTTGSRTGPGLGQYTEPWGGDGCITTNGHFGDSPVHVINAYDKDVDHAHGGQPDPASAPLEFPGAQHKHPATAYEEPYGFDLAPPSRPLSWNLEPAGFSPRSRKDMSPALDETSIFADSCEQSVTHSGLLEQQYSVGADTHASQSIQQSWYAPLHEPRIHGLPSRPPTDSLFDYVSQDSVAYDLDGPLCHFQTGSEEQVDGGAGHEAKGKTSRAWDVEALAPWGSARRSLPLRPNSTRGKVW